MLERTAAGGDDVATSVTRNQLQRLAERLADALALIDERDLLRPDSPLAGSTVAGAEFARREDYEYAHRLIADHAARFDAMSTDERCWIELNADTPQLLFHLDDELDAAATTDDLALERSLTFLRRHIDRYRLEFEQGARDRLDPVDRDLLLGLTRLTRARYRREFMGFYAADRPFIDKFHRDYGLRGVPDAVLGSLECIARADDHDVVVLLLRSALPHGVLLEHLGTDASRLRHLVCGRIGGSHFDARYRFEPVDFDPADLAGKRVLLCDNNAATGATLRAAVESFRAQGVDDLAVALDYVLADVAGLDAPALADHLGIPPSALQLADRPADFPIERRRDLCESIWSDPRLPTDPSTAKDSSP